MSSDDKVTKPDSAWRAQLTPEQYRIMRQQGTERAFTGPWLKEKRAGLYRCAACDAALFRSHAKFDSGTGWPSYTSPVGPDAVLERTDRSHGMTRTEVLCARCEAHLGHVFPDGPPPTGLRYCMNGTALAFVPDAGAEAPAGQDAAREP